MFIEINKRRTGKTTRLVDNAYNYIINNPKSSICILSPFIRSSIEIKTKIMNRIKTNPSVDNSEYERISRNINYASDMSFRSSDEKFYVDDFHQIRDKFFFKKNSYYTTSINNDGESLEDFLYKTYSEVYPNIIRKYKIYNLLNDSNISFSSYVNLMIDK